MAASRSTRFTRSSVGLNGSDENFCGRTLRNRSIAQSDDSSQAPLARARSPKKKPDSQQQGEAPQQSSPKGSHPGKVAEAKNPPAEREPWMSTRKRGLSFSEREGSDKAEGCQLREASPLLKRARGRSRLGEAPGSPAKPERPSSCDTQEGENEDGLKTSQQCPAVGSHDVGEAEVDSKEGSSRPAGASEGQVVSNGLDERDPDTGSGRGDAPMPNPAGPDAASEELCDVSPAECCGNPVLLNGGQTEPSPVSCPAPAPNVPCRSSHSGQAEPGSQQDCPPQTPPTEEEVDVVGDAGGPAQGRAADDTNGGLCAVQGETRVSGEADPSRPSAGPAHAQSPAHVACFTESQEHRYALRTSPRRGRFSPPKLSSPSKDSDLKQDREDEDSEEVLPDPSCSERLGSGRSTSDPPGEPEVKAIEEAGLLETKTSRSTKEPAGSQVVEEDEEDEDDPDVYYFESDHLALKHNKDYQRLLQTIGVLEAQRTQAILDLEALARHQKQALGDPIGFVEQLQKQMVLGLPSPQRVVQLPDIMWDQYTSGLGDFEREFCDKKRNTRRMKLIFDKVGVPARPKSPLDSRKDGESSALYSALPSSDALDHSASSSRTQMVRGRMCDQNKPDTFNQLWTVEEQKKLEQLLLKFPPEEVESKRWQKIADELGNRTAKQVASRVQKYFIKLTKAGIPVPGRTPNLCMYSKKASTKRQHHLNKHLYRPSTFLTSYEPPVYMDDEDDRASFFSSLQDPAAGDSDEESIPPDCRHLPEYKELLQLKKLKKQRLQEMHMEQALTQHLGYKCDACGVEPIQGVRWHCQDCPQDSAVDFCSSCSDCFYKTETHKPDHRLEPVQQAETFLDRDYCLPQSVGYNYLDPNYFPANR